MWRRRAFNYGKYEKSPDDYLNLYSVCSLSADDSCRMFHEQSRKQEQLSNSAGFYLQHPGRGDNEVKA
jgi:hypothetical protein